MTKIRSSNIQSITLDYHNLDIMEQIFFKYICGYLLKKGLEQHICETCITYASATDALDDSLFFCYLKAYENANQDTCGNSKIPHNDFLHFIPLSGKILKNYFKTRDL